MDVTTGHPRFTFGQLDFLSGVGFIPAMIGLFGLSEVLKLASDKSVLNAASIRETAKISLVGALPRIWHHKVTVVRSALLGTFTGSLPGAGADIAAWVSYGIAKKLSREPEKFGTGSEEGVVAPTSANNAALAGAWIPALVFGVPGDTVTAIVVGAMLMYGLRPGLLIFEQSRDIVNSIFVIAVITRFLLLAAGYVGIRAFSRILPFFTRPISALLATALFLTLFGGPMFGFLRSRFRRRG